MTAKFRHTPRYHNLPGWLGQKAWIEESNELNRALGRRDRKAPKYAVVNAVAMEANNCHYVSLKFYQKDQIDYWGQVLVWFNAPASSIKKQARILKLVDQLAWAMHRNRPETLYRQELEKEALRVTL